MSKIKHSSEKEPELPGVPPAPPSEIKLTLIGRSIFQFESYLYSDVLRRHFATNEYLNGLAQEKKSAQIRFGRISARATFLSFILICYISGINFNFNFWGIAITQFPSILEITSLLASLALLATIFTCIDVILIDRVLSHLCSTILGIDSPVYGYAHQNGVGMWIDVFMIRHQGFQSSRAHHLISFGILLYLIVYGIGVIGFITGSVWYGFYFIVIQGNTTSPIFTTVSWLSLFISIVGILIFIVSFFVPFKFTMPSDIHSRIIEKDNSKMQK